MLGRNVPQNTLKCQVYGFDDVLRFFMPTVYKCTHAVCTAVLKTLSLSGKTWFSLLLTEDTRDPDGSLDGTISSLVVADDEEDSGVFSLELSVYTGAPRVFAEFSYFGCACFHAALCDHPNCAPHCTPLRAEDRSPFQGAEQSPTDTFASAPEEGSSVCQIPLLVHYLWHSSGMRHR